MNPEKLTAIQFDTSTEVAIIKVGARLANINDNLLNNNQTETLYSAYVKTDQQKDSPIELVVNSSHSEVITTKPENYSQIITSLVFYAEQPGLKGFASRVTGKKALAKKMLNALCSISFNK